MTTLYHNPNCSKSRACLAALQARKLDINIIAYLDNPPTAAEVLELCTLLRLEAADIVRRGEAIYKTLGLKNQTLTAAEWAKIIADNPKLLERPIVVHDGKAAIGRPLERVMAILP